MTSRVAALAEMVARGKGAAAALEIGEDAVAAFLVQRSQMLAETGLVIHLSLVHGTASIHARSLIYCTDARSLAWIFVVGSEPSFVQRMPLTL